jgi:hypothetical protein
MNSFFYHKDAARSYLSCLRRQRRPSRPHAAVPYRSGASVHGSHAVPQVLAKSYTDARG